MFLMIVTGASVTKNDGHNNEINMVNNYNTE